jgi:spore coat polysaccharide biosynthesis protein SpsF
MKFLAIVQARMGSSRLPGKVMLDIAGLPMLERVVERTKRASLLEDVVVATTNEAQDDAVANFCRERGYPVHRGSLHDVLDRFYQAARVFEAEAVVRITADCPVIDPGLIDGIVREFTLSSVDFAANRLPPPWQRTYPIGLDIEVVTFSALERAWKQADQKSQREHVMPYFYEGIPVDAFDLTRTSLAVSPRGFRVMLVNHVPDYGSKRWTVDTAEDLALMQRVYARFEGRDDFSWQDVLALFEREPELANINSNVVHKSAFDTDMRPPDGFNKDQ